VVAHQLPDPRHLLDPGLPWWRQQVELDVRQPVGRLDDRHAAAGARIGEAGAVGTDAEAQLLGDGHGVSGGRRLVWRRLAAPPAGMVARSIIGKVLTRINPGCSRSLQAMVVAATVLGQPAPPSRALKRNPVMRIYCVL